MTVAGAQEVFDAVGIRMSPDTPGVFILFREARTIFIGMADRSIRRALESHEHGDKGTLTSRATTYWCEPDGEPARGIRQLELLDEYKMVHNMNVPAGNRYPERVAISA
jgi:hypothetical protein